MTPKRIRCFVALDPSAEVHQALVALRSAFAATGADVRWVREGGLHCTLKFLGSVEAERLELIRASLTSAVRAFPPIRIEARGIGVFPGPSRPRIVWVGLRAGGLPQLAEAVENALEPLGFPLEKRRFQAHVTLGRVNGPKGWKRVEEIIRTRHEDSFGTFRIDGIVLYRSEPQRGGAAYTPLWTIPLGASSLSEQT